MANNQEILEKAWQIATDRGWEFDNLDKWHLKAKRKVTTVMNNWYQFVFTYEDKAIVIDAERVIYDHDFAKALWGEHHNPTYEAHYIPARGYPGEPIPKEDIKDSNDDANWVCTRCGKKWSRCFDIPCNLLDQGNTGWQYHLQQMVIADDPIKYLGEHI